MEMVEDVVHVSSSIHTIVSKIMTFQDDWVTLSDEYQHEVDVLNSRLQNCQDQVLLHGEPANKTLMKILKKAEYTLERVAARLDRLSNFTSGNQCCHHIRWWYAKASIVLFPANVEMILKKVNDDFDNFLKVLKEEAEISTQMQQADKRKVPSPKLFHNNDSLYVPIEKAQSAVMGAIEDAQGRQLILLHGGVGRGKSTLARYMVYYYGQDGKTGNREGRDNRNLFEHVIWVSCANCSKEDTSAKQFEILQEHSSNILGDSPPMDTSGGRQRIAKALQDFLRFKKVLIILDDVTDPIFLYEMWDSTSGARHIKYVVTSQWSNICRSLKNISLLIPMGDPTNDEALNILASLVGLEVIPNKLQGIAHKIIQATEKNPLALACLASHFAYSEDNTDQLAWQDAYTELHKLLSNTEEKIVLGSNSTPRSLWAAMKLCLDTLDTSDARKILFVMYGCKGESVPEAILRILHAQIKTSSSTFFKSRNELVMRELVKPAMNSQREGQCDGESKAWSLRSLVRHYIEENMAKEEEIRVVIGELVGDEELACKSRVQCRRAYEADNTQSDEARLKVAMVLCALYFDQSHTDIYEIVTKAMTRASISFSIDSFNDLRRQAIEPIIRLLDIPKEEYWKESQVRCTREVLLMYTCKRQFYDMNISHLLKLDRHPTAQLATLKAIQQICIIEESPLFNKNSLNFVLVLVHLINYNQGIWTSVQRAALKTLNYVCWKAAEQLSHQLIIDSPGVLDFLVSSLTLPNKRREEQFDAEDAASEHHDVQRQVADALASLAYSADDSVKWGIANQDGALGGLAKLLSARENPTEQAQAARALGNLAAPKDTSQLIVNEEGALTGLVECLAASEHHKVQENAAAALANLACSIDGSIKLSIVNQDGALGSLVKLLSAHDKPGAQEQAARALRNLTTAREISSHQHISLQIVNEEGALAGLLECLAASEHRVVQEQAAATLANLAHSPDGSIKLSIANQDRALDGLAKLLFALDKPSVQEQAARAFRSLAGIPRDVSSHQHICKQIVTEEGVLVGLVECLAASEHGVVQEQAAAALANLALSPDGSVKLSIVNQDRALGGLAKLLFAHDKPGVQKQAAWAFQNLAFAIDISSHYHISQQIVNEEGALAGLIECLATSGHRDVQKQAAMALANLAGSQDVTMKLSIASQDGALRGLAKLLSACNKPDMQEEGARAFNNLATTQDNSLKLWIAKEEGALDAFVDCLAAHDHPYLQKLVGSALCHLAESEEANALLKGTKGLLKGLSMLLVDGISPHTQYFGACALTLINLTQGKEASLITGRAYYGRAYAFNRMGMYTEALPDLDKAVDLLKGANIRALRLRSFTKTKLGDFNGALDDANKAVELSISDPFSLQERGILKRLTGDLEGALADLDKGLELETDDYERLKHRGYVKFLLKDEEGARADAEWTLRIKPPRVDQHDYRRGPFLGAIPVEYLGYKLK